MTAPPAAEPNPGYAVRSGRWIRSPQARTWLLYVPICFLATTLAISTWDVRTHGVGVSSNTSSGALLLWLVGIALAVSLAWRRRFPVGITLLTALVPLVLPLDPTAALIAFGSLTVHRFDRVTAAAGGLVGVTTLVATWRDGQGLTKATSFWQLIASSEPDQHAILEPLSWWALVAIALGCLALAVGVAMVVRDREQRRERSQSEHVQQAVVATLSDELARQAERERLAQEVHDALGHRLSLLSLHAGALELSAEEGTRAAQSAALVRDNAQQSMADLRHLLAMLRRPDAPDVAAAVPTLRDIPTLIDETVQTGVTLVSTVQLESVDRLDETTSRSAYRITQELLTNARRHAPGIGVRVRVVATPVVGVEIEVANHLEPNASAAVVAGAGLTGIGNRVTQLGGDWRCWVDEQRVFRAAAHLPWLWEGSVGVDPIPGGKPQ